MTSTPSTAGGVSEASSQPLAPNDAVEEALSRAAERLRSAIAELIDGVPVRVKKPAEFQRVLKLDRSLSSRLLRAMELEDPLAALQRMPGPHGIRLLLKTARKAGADPGVAGRVEEALEDLECLVVERMGDWKSLEAAFAGWLPDTREQFEISNRQTAFRAMSNLKGVTASAEVGMLLIHPNAENPDWVDAAGINVISKMKRLRPGTPMGVLRGSSSPPPKCSRMLSLDGEPIDARHGPPLLRDFCSQPTPSFDVRVDGEMFHYVLQGDGVGLDSQVDLCIADVMRCRYPAYATVDPRPPGPGILIDVPVRTLVVDVLLHEDVWPGVEPELRIYDTVGRGVADPADRSRDMDRIDVLEKIQFLGEHLSRFRANEVARYLEIISHVCERLGWDSERFRAYRCRVLYPVYGTQLCMVFNPPHRS